MVRRKLLGLVIGLTGAMIVAAPSVLASPFGQGVFGADVPFGSATSLAINVGGDVNLSLAPDGGNLSGTGSHVVTVTSTDVVGYRLYAYADGVTDLTGPGSATIPASGNISAAPLSVNSWGFNTTGSTTNFIGLGLTPQMIKDADGPFKNGDNTTVTYGALTNTSQDAGAYTATVVYTVVAENQ